MILSSPTKGFAAMQIFQTDFWSEFMRKQRCLNFFQEKVVMVEPVPDYEVILQKLQTVPDIGLYRESWMTGDFQDSHFVLFKDSMSLLTLSGETEEKRDILAWIFAPNYQERLSKGKVVKRHVSDIPFSFYRCAREIGIKDVDKFREELLGYFEPEVKEKLLKYMQLLH